ncbi:MAG: adenylosuccinate lyase [Candidatus Thermoplasmatota archaeon]|nr:adenylosuccinate lyase [Candidatus Thermoplasmatota archaeon]
MSDLVCPLDFRYGRKEMKEIFSEDRKLQRYLDVEAALARAHAKVGNIPAAAAKEITEKAAAKLVKVERVKEIEAQIRHDVMAVVKAFGEHCSKESEKYIHFGATSYDIVDTANALNFRDAIAVLRSQLVELRTNIVNLADKHKETICIGRTHGQHAVPMTFGLKMAVYAMEVDRHVERLDECKKRVCVGKMSGATGTAAALGEHAAEIQEIVMKDLRIGYAEAATQIVQRDRYAEFVSILANIATSMEKFATEIRNLQRTELNEASEWFDVAKQVGSSTMAQKKNPVACEQICGLARIARSMIIPAYENCIQWHERDLTNSSAERFLIPHCVILTDYVVAESAKVFKNLKVNPEAMLKNIEISNGRTMAESVIIALTNKGCSRQEAHEILRKSAMVSEAEGKHMKEILAKDKDVLKYLKQKEIEAALNPKNYIGRSKEIAEGVVSKLKAKK